MKFKSIWEDTDPISANSYKYVFWQSLLLIVTLMLAYTSIGLSQNLWILIVGAMFMMLSIFFIEKFKFNIFNFEQIQLKYFIFTVSLTVIGLIVYWSISMIAGQPQNQLEVYKDLRTLPIAVSIVIFVILGPIFEELIFRVFIMKGIFKGHLLIGYIVSNILFGIIHGPVNVGEFVIYLVLGFVFASIYIITKRIELSILSHALNNAVHILIFILCYQ